MAVIGGRAHIDGITFVTSTHVVRGRLKNGNVTIYVRKLPHNRLIEIVDKIPFVRGISKMAKLNWKWFLLVVLLMTIPWDWLFPISTTDTVATIWSMFFVYAVGLLAMVFLLNRLWQFHGAEHKVFNVYTRGGQLLPETVRAADRVSRRCGTNLLVIGLPISYLLSVVQIQLIIFIVALSAGYELFNWGSRQKRLKAVFAIGDFIQKYIVTKEPDEEQIRLAIATLSKAIELDRNCVVQ